jgi:hypothetical protein
MQRPPALMWFDAALTHEAVLHACNTATPSSSLLSLQFLDGHLLHMSYLLRVYQRRC